MHPRVTLATNGLPGSVAAVAASYDSSLKYGAQTPFSDQLAYQWVGSLWQYDALHDSIITVGNGGTKPTQAALTIAYNQGTKSYELDQTLQPDEQMWIDVGSLIRQHIPDKDGKVLPENTTMGSYEIHELGQMGIGSLFEGKVVYDKTYGHVTYGCATCCGLKEWQFDYNPLGIPLDGTSQQSVEGVNNCQGTWTDITGYFNGGSWNTANHAIATVNTNGLHSGASEGTTTTSACSKNDMTVWENFDHSPLEPVCPDGATDSVIPTISGPSTLWWFGGQNPNAGSYPVSITLSASGSGTWSIASGSDRISLSTTSGSSTTVTPTGAHFSGSASDTCLTVTVSSETSSQFCLTVRTPWKLVSNPNVSGTESDATYGYSTTVGYDVHDNLDTTISADILWNEAVGTAQNENGSNWATCCGAIQTSGGSTGPLQDILKPPAINSSPTNPSPQPTYNNPPNGTTIYRQASQTIRVGSGTSGQGVQVQADNLTYWLDHGSHENIVSPNQPPQ